MFIAERLGIVPWIFHGFTLATIPPKPSLTFTATRSKSSGASVFSWSAQRPDLSQEHHLVDDHGEIYGLMMD